MEGLEEYALLVMRNGLESLPIKPSSPHPLHISYHAKLKDSGPEGWVPAAIAWIEGYGDALHRASRWGTDVGIAGCGGPRWKDGFQGFSRKRWDLWKDILMEIGNIGCVGIMHQAEDQPFIFCGFNNDEEEDG